MQMLVFLKLCKHHSTWSKMAVGIASVATALGESTIPEIRPSQGQHESKRYT